MLIFKSKKTSTLTLDGTDMRDLMPHGTPSNKITDERDQHGRKTAKINVTRLANERREAQHTFETMSEGEAMWVSQCSHAKNSSPSQ